MERIVVDGVDFHLALGSEGPKIRVHGEDYHHWTQLQTAFPFLIDPAYVNAFALMSNFLARGPACTLILDPAGFRLQYEASAQRAARDLDPSKTLSYDYGLFELGDLHPPIIRRGSLEFFVRDRKTGVPYQVRCSLKKEEAAQYRLLPRVPQT